MSTDLPGRAVRATTVALVSAAAAAVVSLAASTARGPVTVGMDAELPRRVMAGFYPPEREGDLTFAWTSARADLVLVGLPRDLGWACSARLRAGRSTPPHLEILVDGLSALSREAPIDFEEVGFPLTPRTSRADTRISFAVNPTIVPGPQDPRPLGVQVDRISCAPSDGGRLPLSSSARTPAIVGPALFALVSALSGAAAAAALVLGITVAIAQSVPLNTGVAAFTPFVETMTRLGIWIPLLTLLGMQFTGAVRRRGLTPFAAFFACAASAALYVQLLGLLHPSKPPIDVVFQAHRFGTVLAGHYFFTQPMPGGVSFPYAIGLYLFAAPWARLTSDHALLLRIVVCASDAVSYLLLFWLVIRAWRDRVAAAATLMLAFTVPITFEVIGNANLTNEFGHAASTAALVIAAALPGSRRPRLHALVLTVVCTLALVSHVSTFALLAATLLALAVVEWLAGGEEMRRAARTLLIATLASSAIAVAGYYGHFMDVYKDALRVRTGAAAAAAPVPAPTEIRGQTAATLPMRVADSVQRSGTWVGWPLLILGAVGGWRIARERRRDAATLVVVACAAAYVVFVGVAVMRVQPAYQRYTVEFVSRVVLGTSPALLLLAGAGASYGLRRGVIGRIATAALIAAAWVIAARAWMLWFAM
jgi:hypothetical protein